MSAGTSGAEYRSGEYVPAGILALVVLTGVSARMLHGWVERRFGLAVEPALLWAAVPGTLAGALVLLGVLGSRPRMDAEQRRRAAVAAEPKRRRHRVWLIFMLGSLLLGQVVDWPAGGSREAADGGSWNLVLLVAAIVVDGLRDVLPSRAATPGMAAPDQAERCEALRVGFLAATVLGGLGAAVAVRWPGIAAQAWLSALLASVLAAEIRMAMLPRWTARPGGGAV